MGKQRKTELDPHRLISQNDVFRTKMQGVIKRMLHP